MQRFSFPVFFLRILLAGLLLVVSGCGGGAENSSPAPAAGDAKAPSFVLNDLEGNPVSLADSDGQIRIVDFWATWCAPCREEVPMYKEIHAEYGGKGVKIISISMDGEENLDAVKEFVAEYGIPYTNLMDDEEVSMQYQAAGLPATYVLDGEGNIVKNYVGAKPKRILVELLDGMLAGGAGS